MKNNMALTLAAILMTVSVALAQIPAPPVPTAQPPQDRTAVETDTNEVARAISALKPNREQFDAMLKGHKEARNALKLREKAAARALYADYDDQTAKLKAAQAAEKQAMIEKMQ